MNRYLALFTTCLLGLSLIILAVTLALAPAIYANTIITVNSTADVINGADNRCTLREAIIAANSNAPSGAAPDECPAGSGVDTITFVDSGSPDVYTLTIAGAGEDAAATGDLDITEAVTIEGNGQAMTIIEAMPTFEDRVFHILNSGAAGDAVNLENLTIRNGDLLNTGNGGGILNANASTLAITNSTLHNNEASHGGAIVNEAGTVELTSSSLTANQAANQGGGIFNTGFGTVILNETILRGNMAASGGGGIFNEDGMARLAKATIEDNSASTGPGGGILSGGVLNIESSILSQNFANGQGGGIFNISSPTGTLTLENSTLTANSSGLNGGAIYNEEGPATVSMTTIDNNLADNGGGIYNVGALEMTNSTLSQNSALAGSGGGLYNGSMPASNATLANLTLTFNEASATGGGLYNDSGAIELINTIIAENPLGDDCFNNGGTITDLGRNLDSDGTCGLAPPSIPAGNANLGPLQDNGGATQTHALLDGSEAIDAGNDALCPAVDQRGINRPEDGDSDGTATCDIGAFELALEKAFAPIIISGDD